MAVFNGVDFLRIDDLLTDEEKTIRQSVRDWVEDKYLPLVEHHYEAATFPMDIIPQIAELGLLGANLPVEYGCAGIGDVAYGAIEQTAHGFFCRCYRFKADAYQVLQAHARRLSGKSWVWPALPSRMRFLP